MPFIKSTASLAGAAVFAVAFAVSAGPAEAAKKKKAAPMPTTTPTGLVIWKKGKPATCGAYFYFNAKRKMCHDARWK